MSAKRALLLFVLLLTALPLVAHDRKVVLVMVDVENNRAYIPEGTVLPPGMNVRMEKFSVDKTTFESLRGDRDGAKGNAREVRGDRASMARLKAKPPLVLEYAPAERFVQMRKNYEAQAAKRGSKIRSNSHMNCFDTYVQDSATGYYGTYYNGFTSTFCQQSSGITVGVANDWEFHAAGDGSDDDWSISPYVYVDDNNNNFTCFDDYSYGGDVGYCGAYNSTVLLQQGCLNIVDTGATLYTIEYLNNYVENYLGYSFLVDYCTYFY